VFLFSLLLAYFLVPPELRGRVILIGIAGALLLRGSAIAGGVALVESVEAIVYVFGALLLFVAYRALRGADEASDPEANPVLRFVRRLVPTTSAGAACSYAKPAVSTARRCCWWWSRSSPPTSPSPSTRSRRPSR
jgi:predicted tellurium resistance membrane protein TerC